MRGLLLLGALASCGPETTSFRTTDRSDGSERDTPPAAAYDVEVARKRTANVYVWSNGGYIGTSNEPMTHVGFEIRNRSQRPLVFDAESLQLIVYDKHGRALPRTELTVVTPIGPDKRPIAAEAAVVLDVYFTLHVRPRAVETMRVRWALEIGDERYTQWSSFTRDDEFPTYEPPSTTTQPGS
jgi:hypothetical protein